jgi:hypothetical protein
MTHTRTSELVMLGSVRCIVSQYKWSKQAAKGLVDPIEATMRPTGLSLGVDQ